jgi:RNA polymerase sigma-70 factor (ECF subfamily)
MLGSRTEAEDVVQDAYLRWHRTATSEIRSAKAWLVTTVTRLAIDRLRELRTERES